MGSMRERGPGVYELRVWAHGKATSRTFRGTAAEARSELVLLEARAISGEFVTPVVDEDNPTIREWLEDWYARQSPTWSPSSAATARGHIDNHITPALGDRRLGELRRADVGRWLQQLREKGLSPATQLRVYGVLRSALEQAERWELIARNPAAKVDLPKVRYEEPTTPSAMDLVQAIEACTSIHQRTLVWLAAATGGRRGQLVALRWSDFNLDDELLTFHRAAVKVPGGSVVKEPKGGKPIRVPIDPYTVDVVKAYRRHRQEQALKAGRGRLAESSYMFSRDPGGRTHWYPDTASKMWDEVRSARGPDVDGEPGPLLLPQLQGVRLHDLRHAHATILIAGGVSRRAAADRLGHAQVSTTDRYTHPVTEAERAAAAIIGEVLSRGA